MIHTLENTQLKISVKNTGAELCSIINLKTGQELMWQADPKVWEGHAPILFPIVGALKDQTYYYNDKDYQLPQHGFFRRNSKVRLVEQTENSLTFYLESDSETLKVYPFAFAFYTTYTLDANSIIIAHTVKNKDSEPLYFSLGAHPAFRCPLHTNEEYADYYIELEQNETARTHQITATGLIGPETDSILNNNSTINLSYNLFDKGALIFKKLQSRKARLVSKKNGKILEVSYKDFPFLGIWAKPNANYVCIEPWLGIADSVDSNQDITQKEGILKLSGLLEFSAEYTISIF